jgi:hypothetical protein
MRDMAIQHPSVAVLKQMFTKIGGRIALFYFFQYTRLRKHLSVTRIDRMGIALVSMKQ